MLATATTPHLRAAVYEALAGALGEPPPWLALPGKDWPLRHAAARLLPQMGHLAAATAALAAVPAAPAGSRRQRYQTLFAGPGRPRFWLHESLYRGGRLIGPVTAALEQIYAAAGLAVCGGELPDHASVELAFLAHLVRLQAEDPALAPRWRNLERQYVAAHIARWLPALGRRLEEDGDLVYGPIGSLLAALFDVPPRSHHRPKPKAAQRPALVDPAACTLCSFCIPVCPTRALAVAESARETRLMLRPAACTGCRLCVQTCPQQALTMRASGATNPAPLWTLLASPRLTCSTCGAPTVSEAEFDFVAERIGSRSWMRLCLACRGAPVENRK